MGSKAVVRSYHKIPTGVPRAQFDHHGLIFAATASVNEVVLYDAGTRARSVRVVYGGSSVEQVGGFTDVWRIDDEIFHGRGEYFSHVWGGYSRD